MDRGRRVAPEGRSPTVTELEQAERVLAEVRAVVAAWEAQASHEPPDAGPGWHLAKADRWLARRPSADELREQVRRYAAIADGWEEESWRWLRIATRLGMDLTPFEREDETIARLREEVRGLRAAHTLPEERGET